MIVSMNRQVNPGNFITKKFLPAEASGLVDTTPEEIKYGGFHSENASNIFRPVHATPEEFQSATITGHFGFVFQENSVREIT